MTYRLKRCRSMDCDCCFVVETQDEPMMKEFQHENDLLMIRSES